MTRRACFVQIGLTALTAVIVTSTAAIRAQTPAPASSASSATSPVEPGALRAADAKALLGDWTITAQGQQGPTTIALTLKADGDKTVGQISSDVMEPTTITDITKAGDSVFLRYTFDYQGNTVPTVVTLTPSGETLAVSFDFADGAYTMTGTASRKKAS
jgi:invasion protein IalB